MDHYLRREAVWKPMLKGAKAKWSTIDDSECAHLMRMLSNLQLVPTQGVRRSRLSAGQTIGWQPDGGWAG
eukprot:7380240-Prymnesium_polylepis.1